MFRSFGITWVSLTLLVLVLGACGRKAGEGVRQGFSTETPNGSTQTQSGGSVIIPTPLPTTPPNPVQCAVSAPDMVDSGQTISITIIGSGGTAPYSIPARGVSFQSSTTISGTYTNTTTSNRIVEGTFQILDSANRAGSCYLRLTVRPAQVTNINSCSLAVSSATPSVNQPFYLTVSILGGATSFLVKQLNLDSNWVISPNTQVSATSQSYQLTYIYSGPKTIVATVNIAGSDYTCSAAINVQGINPSPSPSPTPTPTPTPPPLTGCDIISSNPTALVGSPVRIRVAAPVGQGVGPFQAALSISSAPMQDLGNVDSFTKMVRFFRPGTFSLVASLRDQSTGYVASCSSTQVVRSSDIFAAGQDSPGRKVRIYRGAPAQEILTSGGFEPFADVLPNFQGGIRVATADVNGDGTVDIITAAGYNGGLRIRAFSGVNLTRLHNFVAFQGVGTNRTYIAAGDIDADGYADIVVGNGCNASSPRVEIYSGRTGALVRNFSTFNSSGGNRVAAGDVNGDGYSDVVVSSCVNSNVHAYSGRDITVNAGAPSPIKNFHMWPGVSTNMKVAVGDVNGDGYADIIGGTNGSTSQEIRIFSGRPGDSTSPIATIVPWAGKRGTNYVSAGDINGDGRADIIVGGDGTYPGEIAEIKVFNGVNFSEIYGAAGSYGQLVPFGSNFNGRLYVAGGNGTI